MIVTLSTKSLNTRAAHIPAKLPPITRALVVGMDQYLDYGNDFQIQRRAADAPNELAPPHSITSSARASSDGGRPRPSALAVVTLMTSSNFVGCSTGRSAGFAPRRILST